jgi:hypothetical protein
MTLYLTICRRLLHVLSAANRCAVATAEGGKAVGALLSLVGRAGQVRTPLTPRIIRLELAAGPEGC